MKTRYIYILCLLVNSFWLLTSCEDKKDELQQELPYLFRPVNFTAETNKTVATVKWAPVDSAKGYIIEISQDSLTFQNIIKTDTVSETQYVIELGGNTRYSARVKAMADKTERDSKFNAGVTFKTPAENVSEGYTSIMVGQGSALVRWIPGSNVTRLVFKADGKQDVEFVVSAAEKAAGKKVCSNLTNGAYSINFYNGQFEKGKNNALLEGDVFLNSTDDLVAALTAATDGQVIVLMPGVFNVGGSPLSLTKNIKIRGLYPDTLSTVCMGGTASSTANMFNIGSTSTISAIKFENLDITGYVGNSSSGTKIGYLFNQSTACDLGELSFRNCKIHNLGNTPIRLKDAPIKKIENLIIENSIMNEIGWASVYAIVNNNVAGCVINNIRFSNNTIYNFTGSLVLHTTGNSNSVTIENCTFNEMLTSGTGTSVRYFIDYNTYTVNNSILVKNCIFGSTPRNMAGGIRASASTSKAITGSYVTNDFVESASATTGSIVGSLTAYTGSSTDLFVAPTTGNFNFKDNAFAGKSTAGDPRWRK